MENIIDTMNSSKLTNVCKVHLVAHKKIIGHGALLRLSKILSVDVGTLRGISSGRNLNATGSTIEKILKHFNNPLYSQINDQLTSKKDLAA
jgi:hypothetical protein